MQNLFYRQICVLDGLNLDDRDRKVYLSGFGALGSREKVGMGSMAMDSFTDINGPQPFERWEFQQIFFSCLIIFSHLDC